MVALPNGLPFGGAVKTTIDDAESTLGQHIPRGDDPLASDALIKTVWINASRGQVAIDYSTGLQELATLTEPAPDPLAAAQAAAAPLPGATVETIQGVPALVIPGDTPGNCPQPTGPCAPAQNNPTSVTFYLEGFGVEIDAPGTTPTDDIVRVAGTAV